MTQTTKMVLIGASLLGFATGAATGANTVKKYGPAMEAAQFLTTESVSNDFSARQFQYADNDHARQAVQFEINLRQQLQRCQSDDTALDRERNSAELAFAYTGLAMVEEAAGHNAEARVAFDEAKLLMKKANPREDVTDEQLRTAVRKLDAATNKVRM